VKIFISISVVIFIFGCRGIPLSGFSSEVASAKVSRESRVEESRETIKSTYNIEEPKEVSIESNRTERVVKERKREKRRSRADIKKLRELRRVMREFDYIIFNRINMEMLQGEEDMFFGKNLNPLLKDFIKGTERIASLYPDGDDRYRAISKSLHKKAKVLNYIIKKRKTEYFKLQLDSIIDTCNLCHSLYN